MARWCVQCVLLCLAHLLKHALKLVNTHTPYKNHFIHATYIWHSALHLHAFYPNVGLYCIEVSLRMLARRQTQKVCV